MYVPSRQASPSPRKSRLKFKIPASEAFRQGRYSVWKALGRVGGPSPKGLMPSNWGSDAQSLGV